MTMALNSAVVRIRATDDRVVGAGFLVGQRMVLTCAHVVAQALDLPEDWPEAPQAEVVLDFPLIAPEQRLVAQVARWRPVLPDGSGDVAALELVEAPPSGVRAVRLVEAEELWDHPFRAFGFPKGYDNGVWASGRILGREATGWLQIEDVKQTGYFVAPGFSGGPVWDEELDGVVGMTVAAETRHGIRAAFIIPTDRLVVTWPELGAWAIPPCPYRGLMVFREQDAPFFFGREEFTERLIEAVQQHALIAVTGPSGSGKSSVIFAGLLSHLLQESPQQAAQGNAWSLVGMRPGSRPFDKLAGGLLLLLEPKMTEVERLRETRLLARMLQEGEVELLPVVERALGKYPEAGRTLLVVDQFEELYTLCQEPEARRRFLDVLLVALAGQSVEHEPTLTLVLTLRADFLGQALAYRPFADALDQAHKLMLGPMTSEELKAAILRPAERQGVAFEEGLVARILDDVGDEPGNLPLLEFALTQLWERQESGRLTHSAYDAIGKVEGALTRYADEVYAGLSKVEQEQARRILVQLVRPGEGTEDTRRLAARAEMGEEDWPLVQKLADERLVVTDRDPAGQEVVEVAHEALIRGWRRLRDWMEEDRDFRMWQERLRAAVRQWEASGRDEGALLRGVSLAEAKGWLAERGEDLNKTERTFVKDSLALQKREHTAEEKRQRRLVFGAVGTAVVFLLLAAWAWGQRNQSTQQANLLLTSQVNVLEQRDKAESAQATAEAEAVIRATAQSQAETRRQEAEVARVEAETRRQEAEEQGEIALARQLAAQAEAVREQRGAFLHRSLLLAVESLRHHHTLEGYLAWSRGIDLAPRPVSQMTHEAPVFTVAFSPDDRWVASGSDDSTVRVWEAATGKEVARMIHEDRVRAVAFGPDSRWVVSGSDDDTARVWEAATGQEVARMTHESGVSAVAFSPDGQWVVSGDQSGAMQVWEATTARSVLLVEHRDVVNAVAFSPDGRWVVSGYGYDRETEHSGATIWEVTTGRAVARMAHEWGVNAAAFSPDGRWVASGGSDNTVRVWEAATGKEVARMAHESGVSAAAFSPDGRWVVSGGDNTVRVWEAATGQEVARMTHHGGVRAVAFSPDGQRVVSGSWDDTARVWEAATGKEVARMVHGGYVYDVAFSPGGQWVVSGSNDNTVRVWEVTTGPEVARMVHGRYVNDVAFSPDGQWVVSGSWDDTARVWEAATGKEVARMTHENLVNDVAFSPDGQWVVSGGWDSTARVWEAATGQEVARMTHENLVNDVAFSSDGQWVVSGSWGRTVRVWEAATGQEVARMAGGTRVVAFSPDGQWVASGSDDDTARVWEAATGKEVARMIHEDRVRAVAFSPDSRWVVSGSDDDTARVWEAATGQEVARMTHESEVSAVAFSPDGQWVVSGGEDNTVRVWEAATGQEVARMTHEDRVRAVAFSPDDRWVASGGEDNTVRVWPWQTVDLVAEACSHLPRNLTLEEWHLYVGPGPYRRTCSNLPGPAGWEDVPQITPSPAPSPTPTLSPPPTLITLPTFSSVPLPTTFRSFVSPLSLRKESLSRRDSPLSAPPKPFASPLSTSVSIAVRRGWVSAAIMLCLVALVILGLKIRGRIVQRR